MKKLPKPSRGTSTGPLLVTVTVTVAVRLPFVSAGPSTRSLADRVRSVSRGSVPNFVGPAVWLNREPVQAYVRHCCCGDQRGVSQQGWMSATSARMLPSGSTETAVMSSMPSLVPTTRPIVTIRPAASRSKASTCFALASP